MILECLGCRQSYDVSKYKAGQKLRCRCGQIIAVPDSGWHPRRALTLHCANCGGNLEKGAPSCSFCGAMVDLTATRLTAYCPACLSMSKEGASFCSGCGKALLSPIDRPEKADERCPRCNVSMRNRNVDAHRTVECPVCLGMFVSVDAFDSLVRKQEDRVGEMTEGDGARKSVLVPETVTYIKCPECQGIMNRLNYGRISGVIIDYCRKHGYWLDNGELEKIADFVASGGLKERYLLEMEDAKAAAAKAKLERALAESSSMRDSPMYTESRDRPAASGLSGLFDIISGLFE